EGGRITARTGTQHQHVTSHVGCAAVGLGCGRCGNRRCRRGGRTRRGRRHHRTLRRSEEHTSELQSLRHLVCRLLLEKKKNRKLYAFTKNQKNVKLNSSPNHKYSNDN